MSAQKSAILGTPHIYADTFADYAGLESLVAYAFISEHEKEFEAWLQRHRLDPMLMERWMQTQAHMLDGYATLREAGLVSAAQSND
ncbi:hypothetical protein BI364_07095 [Acidihalobacter yilgarnensis]|uniref:Uncharacterized protein n=1 Tax=Acidihalobacter yilgarnensis TaxID=2819280 RepID=A0A1D8IMR0_9GAMM|nr:hypothetical protein [Acidihalobacter yilgarnensis]AOU97758.1 hypothetical protein BI364_07095 [Acidihalobacter yilgarnensis]